MQKYLKNTNYQSNNRFNQYTQKTQQTLVSEFN